MNQNQNQYQFKSKEVQELTAIIKHFVDAHMETKLNYFSVNGFYQTISDKLVEIDTKIDSTESETHEE